LFIVGVGGGAGHASHAVNDFRKLCLIESYAPTDNVSELTARVNDDVSDFVVAHDEVLYAIPYGENAGIWLVAGK
jgi:hypothetical protein